MRRKAGIGEVPLHWQVAPLRSFVNLVTYGFTNPMPTTEVGPYKITAADIYDGRIQYQGARHTSPEAYTDLLTDKSRPVIGDVLLTKDGSIGRVAVVDQLNICINQSVALLRPNHQILSRFLKFLLETPYYQNKMDSDSDGSTIKHIYITRVDKMEVAVPPVEEQQRILNILGSLDDKIELNRRTNETLEAMARTLFRSWFVDFDPVRAKADGQKPHGMDAATAKLFPNSFEPSALGPIPKGWQIGNLGEFVTRVAMGPFGSSITTDNFVDVGVPVVRGGNLKNGFVDQDFVYLKESKANELRNANAFPGDVVITHRGTLGQVGLIPSRANYSRYVVSQSQMLVRPDPKRLPSHYVYHFLTSEMGQHALLANTSQTGVPAIAQPTTSVKAIRVIKPSSQVLMQFEMFALTLYDAITLRCQESRTLAATRDALLPKLLSGEVRVSADSPHAEVR